MENIESLNAYLEQKYPQDNESYTYEDLRTAFVEGINYKITHTNGEGYCNARIWHNIADLIEVTHEVDGQTVTEMVHDLPEFNKVCVVKFSDGTGGISTRSKTSKGKNQWVTTYRDDIVAWSYYVMGKVNENYV